MNWQVDRVYIYDASGELASLPAEWTDVVVATGRSPFHIAKLVGLAICSGVLTKVMRPLLMVGGQ